MFTSDTDSNNIDLNDNGTRKQKHIKKKIRAPKMKADSRFVWEITLTLLEICHTILVDLTF